MNVTDQQTTNATRRPIGVMSAMTEEIAALVANIHDLVAIHERGMRTYYRGHLWGRPAVLVYSRWGKVAAATTATCLITEFDVEEIVFTGVAGGVAPGVRVGDVVIGGELVQHDMDARPLYPRHEIPLLGRSIFPTDPLRRAAAAAAARSFLDEEMPSAIDAPTRAEFAIDAPRMHVGMIASGDKFFSSRADVDGLLGHLPSVLCVEMEGAAVAQVCHEYGVPCTVIRTISDAADEGAPIDFPTFIARVASTYSNGIIHRMIVAESAQRADSVPSERP